MNITDGRPKVRYLVAVDAAHNTLEEIVKAISDHLGTGRVDHTPKEEALVDKNLSVRSYCRRLWEWLNYFIALPLQQNTYDHLMVNLVMEATYVRESMHINWAAEDGLVENIKSVIKEFKQARGLHVGQTTSAAASVQLLIHATVLLSLTSARQSVRARSSCGWQDNRGGTTVQTL